MCVMFERVWWSLNVVMPAHGVACTRQHTHQHLHENMNKKGRIYNLATITTPLGLDLNQNLQNTSPRNKLQNPKTPKKQKKKQNTKKPKTQTPRNNPNPKKQTTPTQQGGMVKAPPQRWCAHPRVWSVHAQPRNGGSYASSTTAGRGGGCVDGLPVCATPWWWR